MHLSSDCRDAADTLRHGLLSCAAPGPAAILDEGFFPQGLTGKAKFPSFKIKPSRAGTMPTTVLRAGLPPVCAVSASDRVLRSR